MKSKDYKVTINHKLNFKLKPKAGPGELFPLYLEVRAKRQITFLKSRFGAYVTKETFEEFLKDDLVKLALEYEKAEIENSIRDFGINEDNFLLTSWYEAYSKHLIESRWPSYVIKQMIRPVQDFCMSKGISRDDISLYFLSKEQIASTVRILSALGYPDFKSLSQILDFLKSAQNAFIEYDRYFFSKNKTWSGYIEISGGLSSKAFGNSFIKIYLQDVNAYLQRSGKEKIDISNITYCL